MRIIIISLIAFGAGFFARPWLIDNFIPYLPPWVIEQLGSILSYDEPPQPLTFGFTGFLTEDGFRGSGGNIPAGEGVDQLFSLCDPVDIRVTMTTTEGGLIYFPSRSGAATRVENAEFDFEMTVGPRDILAVTGGRPVVSLGHINEGSSDATASGLFLTTSLNDVDAVGAKGDAFGYIELIHALSFTSETEGAAGLTTYAEVAAFFSAVTSVSGRFEFRYCDESLNGGFCPSRSDFGLPFATNLRFTQDCSFG